MGMRKSKLCTHISSQIRQETTSASARQGFGSFHCEDVETLIRLKDEEYKRPEVYDEILSHAMKRSAEIVNNFEYGTTAKIALFALGRSTFDNML